MKMIARLWDRMEKSTRVFIIVLGIYVILYVMFDIMEELLHVAL